MASVGSIIGGAIRLVRERPGSVAVWALTYLVGSIAVFLMVGGMFMANMANMSAGGFDSPGANPLHAIGSMIGSFFLAYLLFLFLIVILINAVFRAVLRPGESGFASMRVGMDEFRMLGLVILVAIGFGVAFLIAELLLMLLISVVAMATGHGAVTALASLLLGIGFFCGVVWIEVRLSVIFPLSFYRRKMTLDGAWELTRGRFWTLFGAYLVIFLISFALILLVALPTMGPMLAAITRAHGDPAQAQIEMRSAMMQASNFGGLGIVGAIAFGVVSAINFALGTGVLASATRELLIEKGERFDDGALAG
jgi:hypothetical protein